MGKTAKKTKKLRRVRLFPRSGIFAPGINNRPPRNWDLGYEIVVSFHYGLDEDNIRSVIGLRNCDSGMSTNRRDLMFPCGTEKTLAHSAAGRLVALDVFGALEVKISYPIVYIGKDSFTPWYSADGKLLEMIKHRKLKLSIRPRRERLAKRNARPVERSKLATKHSAEVGQNRKRKS